MRPTLLILAGVAVGLGAEWVAFDWSDPRDWVPDLAVGWTFIAGGLVASARRPDSRVGALLAVTGFAWFAGSFASQLTYLHRGVLVHAVLAYPGGRLSSRLERAIVAAGYGVSLLPAVAASDVATAALGTALIVGTARGYRAARGPARRARAPAMRAAALAGGVLVASVGARLAFAAGDANVAVLLAYQAALCAIVVVLVRGLQQRPEEAVADLVVELGGQRSGTLRDGLARVLGEPELEIGYWSPSADGYVDDAGRAACAVGPGEGRAVTVIEHVAALVHDPAVLGDKALVDGIESAARLAAVNARLQAEVQSQLAELRASRAAAPRGRRRGAPPARAASCARVPSSACSSCRRCSPGCAMRGRRRPSRSRRPSASSTRHTRRAPRAGARPASARAERGRAGRSGRRACR